MKELYLVRHAKSSWKNERLSDLERPLNKRGRRDAPFMGKLLKQQNIIPDLLISSPANRALTTAKIFAEELGYLFDKLVIDPRLYMAGSHEFADVISEVGDNYNSIMIFSHNPGLTDFVNRLNDKSIDNVPTCGIVAFKINSENWEEINQENTSLSFFEYPKKFFESK